MKYFRRLVWTHCYRIDLDTLVGRLAGENYFRTDLDTLALNYCLIYCCCCPFRLFLVVLLVVDHLRPGNCDYDE